MPPGKQEEDLDPEQFEWIKVRDIVQQNANESLTEKFMRKSAENVLVPVGCLVTASCLFYGLWNFKEGNRKMSQYMMRARVIAQGFTLTVLLIGMGLSAKHAGRK